jgi:hypothetical protein
MSSGRRPCFSPDIRNGLTAVINEHDRDEISRDFIGREAKYPVKKIGRVAIESEHAAAHCSPSRKRNVLGMN